MNYLAYIAIAVATWNVLVFALYGNDKQRAKKKQWRISERTLILSAFCMGACGALLGMWLFRHKTKHQKFTILVPIALVLNVAVAVVCYLLI